MKVDNKKISKKSNKISNTSNKISNTSNKISNEDFNSQLYKLLSDQNEVDDNVCLITNLPLEHEYITLRCGHKFNYKSIFNEITNQKCQHNQLEVTRLKKNQIKCPYCRNIQTGLLPYRTGFLKTKFVNHPENMQYLPNSCVYAFLSGKRKGEWCGKKCSDKYCKNHKRLIDNRTTKAEMYPQSTQNIIITSSLDVGCKYIYKRGQKKGTSCPCKKIYNLELCKTHWKQVHKTISI
tara:strand:+ start:617 stop:1324 length:708 start_codon:yes stop_codon:yes gene_type:complete